MASIPAHGNRAFLPIHRRYLTSLPGATLRALPNRASSLPPPSLPLSPRCESARITASPRPRQANLPLYAIANDVLAGASPSRVSSIVPRLPRPSRPPLPPSPRRTRCEISPPSDHRVGIPGWASLGTRCANPYCWQQRSRLGSPPRRAVVHARA